MDFSRNTQVPAPVAPAHAVAPVSGNRGRNGGGNNMARVAVVLGVVLVAVLLVFASLSVFSTSSKTNEDQYVDSTKLQAVFLNTGQVYFGKIQTLNDKFFVVTNIYYLQTSSTGTGTSATSANTSVSLVKLGCELHEPFDKMVINRSQVTFWENLQDNGQVAKAVATFQKQNPTGQKCTDQSTNASTGASTVQGATTNSATNTSGTTSGH